MSGIILYSMAEFLPVIRRLFPRDRTFSLVEIGSEAGTMTRELVEMVEQGRIHPLTIIEPVPGEFLEGMGRRDGVSVVKATSHEALPRLPIADVYLIDGDHNYYTVEKETAIILERAESEGKAPLLLYHDVCWPWDRRDLYYAPEKIPAEHRQDHVYHLGVTTDTEDLVPDGFRAFGKAAVARRRGGGRNGVRTAIEDVLRGFPDWQLHVVPVVFGLGVVLSRRHPEYDRVVAELAPFADNPLLERLERNRIELFLKVQRMTDERDAATARGDRRPRVLTSPPAFPPQVSQPWPPSGWLSEMADLLSASRGQGCVLAVEFCAVLAHEPPGEEDGRDESVVSRLRERGILSAPLRDDEYSALRAAAESRARESAGRKRCSLEPIRTEVFMELAAVLRDPSASADAERAVVMERLTPNPAGLGLLKFAQDLGWKVAVTTSEGYESGEVREFLSSWLRHGKDVDTVISASDQGTGIAGGVIPLLVSRFDVPAERIRYLASRARQAARWLPGGGPWIPWRDTLFFAGPEERGDGGTGRGAAGNEFQDAARSVLAGVPGTIRNINPLPPDVVFSLAPVLCRFADWCVREMELREIRHVACVGNDGPFLARMLSKAGGNRLHVEFLDCFCLPLNLAALGPPSEETLASFLADMAASGLDGALASLGLSPEDFSPESYGDLLRMSARDRRLTLLRELVVGPLRDVVAIRSAEQRKTVLTRLESVFSGHPHGAIAGLDGFVGLQNTMNRVLRLAGSPTRLSGFFHASGDRSRAFLPQDGPGESFLAGIGADGVLYAPVWKTPDGAGSLPGSREPRGCEKISRVVEGVLAFQEMWLSRSISAETQIQPA